MDDQISAMSLKTCWYSLVDDVMGVMGADVLPILLQDVMALGRRVQDVMSDRRRKCVIMIGYRQKAHQPFIFWLHHRAARVLFQH